MYIYNPIWLVLCFFPDGLTLPTSERLQLRISAVNGTCTRQFRWPTGVEIHRPCVSPGQTMHDFNDLPTVGWLDERNLRGSGGFKDVLFSSPIWGKVSNLTDIFQKGWNHQLTWMCLIMRKLKVQKFKAVFWLVVSLWGADCCHIPLSPFPVPHCTVYNCEASACNKLYRVWMPQLPFVHCTETWFLF